MFLISDKHILPRAPNSVKQTKEEGKFEIHLVSHQERERWEIERDVGLGGLSQHFGTQRMTREYKTLMLKYIKFYFEIKIPTTLKKYNNSYKSLSHHHHHHCKQIYFSFDE